MTFSFVSRLASGLGFATLLALAGTPAFASTVEPRVAVPSQPGVEGCWTADRNLYGPYRLRFCLNGGQGSYHVTGGGLDCRAGLHVSPQWGGGYAVSLRRAHCGRGTDWTADQLSCRLVSDGWGNGGYDDYGRGRPRVAVPTPSRSHLACTYRPAAWGYGTTTFTAHRG